MLAICLVVVADVDHRDMAIAFDYGVAIGKFHVPLIVRPIEHAALVVLGDIGIFENPNGILEPLYPPALRFGLSAVAAGLTEIDHGHSDARFRCGLQMGICAGQIRHGNRQVDLLVIEPRDFQRIEAHAEQSMGRLQMIEVRVESVGRSKVSHLLWRRKPDFVGGRE